MNIIPLITGKELVKLFESRGFVVIRQRGSHVRLQSADGRLVTVPVHAGKELPRGFTKKILVHDAKFSDKEIEELFE